MEQLKAKEPDFADGDDDGGELNIDFIPDDPLQFYWTKDRDEIRRAFIFDKMADPSLDARILVENMDHIFRWLTKGEVPKIKKSHLKVAES